jgi:hypothetical protein
MVHNIVNQYPEGKHANLFTSIAKPMAPMTLGIYATRLPGIHVVLGLFSGIQSVNPGFTKQPQGLAGCTATHAQFHMQPLGPAIHKLGTQLHPTHWGWVWV